MRKKILVVDDQKINRSILSRLLSDSYEVLEAENGKIALEILRQNSEETSAVILDLIMPVLDGYGVLKAMKEEENLSGIPVIVATQADKGEIEEEALKLGARDFITKPYNPGVLRRRLKNLIELYESNICISHIERDSLTGVYTKEAFCRRASRIIMEHKEKEYLIAATNIKHFKLVNDIFGNQEGDKFLKYIAGIVGKGTEERGGICARSSADHFLCLIPWDKDEKMIRELVDRVSERIDEYPLNMKISMMYGIYEVEDREVPVTIMCDRALLAAQSIKGRYDTAYAFYDDAVRQHLLTEQEITNEMNRALEQEQFQVYFQPKYDLVSEAVAGAEALVRWNHPKLGFMNPVDFVPLFEKNGFITALDKYVWEKTCEMIAKWIKEDKKSVPVSVNVSRKDIYDENLPQTLLNIINKYGLKAEHLHLEITETAYTENADQLIRVVGQLKKLGFVIEMDDFGSGYSSLNMLSELPIDILKLDMRFIQRETAKNDSRGILSFIISMAKWMNLDVVAEGVETQTQVTLLRNIDCDYVQGYFYAKPMTKDEFTRLVRKGNLTADTDEIEQEMIKNGITEHERITEKIMLIVDDLSLNRELLAEYFKGIYTIVEADNGLAAYSYIQEHFDRIEIIMLDLIMPRMDGYELLKKLQSNSLYSPIPVIVTSQVGKDGEAQAFELGASDFLSKPYNYQIARHRVRNVTARLEAQTLRREKDMLSKMRRLALEAKLDPFTGVYNRMEMERQIQDYFNKNQDAHAIFIMLDIDNFKTINDNFGHETGDAAIQKVADILLRKFREEDIVCRMGGDEFAVFIKADFADEHLLQRLSSLHTQLQFTIETQEVTCSIGVCVAPQHGKNYQEMYHNADVSLLTAKRLGKNQVKIYGGTSELPDHVLYRNMDWLLDESSDAVIISDVESYEMYYLNNVACQIAQKEKEECIGIPCYQAIWNRQSPCSHCIDSKCLTRDYGENEIHPEGTDASYLVKSKVIDWGNRKARIQYVHDYTDRAKFRQKEMEISEERFSRVNSLKDLIDHMPGALCLYKWDGENIEIIHYSSRLPELLGEETENFEISTCDGESIEVHPEDLQNVRTSFRKLLYEEKTIDSVFRILIKKENKYKWLRLQADIKPQEDGSRMVYALYTDVDSNIFHISDE